MSKTNTVYDDNPPRMDEEQQFFTILNDKAAAHSAEREKERRESRAARDQKRAANKAKMDRARRIHWWLGLFHWIVHYAGCACAIFCALLFGLPHKLAIFAAVLTLAELVWVSRRLAQTRPRKESRNG